MRPFPIRHVMNTKRYLCSNTDGIDALVSKIEGMKGRRCALSTIPGKIVGDYNDRSMIRYVYRGQLLYVKFFWANGIVRLMKDLARGGRGALREASGFSVLNECGLNHPQILAYGTSMENIIKGFSYIVTREVAHPVTIADYFCDSKDISVAYRLGEDIAAMHSRNIVHNDLHPENVLLSYDNQKKLYFLDSMEVRCRRRRDCKIRDLVNFFYYADRFSWIEKEEVFFSIFRSYCRRFPDIASEPKRLQAFVLDRIEKRGNRRFSAWKNNINDII